MEARKISIVSTEDSSTKTITTGAETLGQLKQALRENGINYSGMTFYEGLTQTEICEDTSLLPRDVRFEDKVTNELVFMLTNNNKKIPSGASDRMSLYNIIKENNLQEACLEKFGRNFTLCKTYELEELVNEYVDGEEETNEEKPAQAASCPSLIPAFKCLVDILVNNDVIYEEDAEEIISKLPKVEDPNAVYSQQQIDKMFAFVRK